MRKIGREWAGLCGLWLAATLTGCAAPSPEALAANDPFEQANRAALKRNAWIDKTIVMPTLRFYVLLVPEGGRRGVHNFLGNLQLPTIFVNDMLQGELSRAGKSLWRLAINSTIGLGGFFDPASKIGISGHGEDFGQTLAVWGVKEGPYLVLPVIGPSNPRDAMGRAVDLAIDPTNQIVFKQHIWWSVGRQYFTLLDLKDQTYQTIEGIQRSSVDYYLPARPVPPVARRTDPQWPQTGRRSARLLIRIRVPTCLELATANRENRPNRKEDNNAPFDALGPPRLAGSGGSGSRAFADGQACCRGPECCRKLRGRQYP